VHLALLACLLTAADGDTGTFVKAPGANVVAHQLGSVPRALVIWTVYAPLGAPRAGYQAAVGLSDGAQSYSIAASSAGGVAPSIATRRIAKKLLTVAALDGGIVTEGELTGATASSFTVTWSPDDATPAVIHYLLVAGARTVAKVVTFQMPDDAGTVAVGTGFRPDAVLFLASGLSTHTIPMSDVIAHLSFGAADSSGRQWVGAIEALDGSDPSVTGSFQGVGACVAVGDPPYVLGRVAAFDDGGFTVDFPVTDVGEGYVVALALAGLDAEAGSLRVGEPAHIATDAVLLQTTSDDPTAGAAWALGAVTAAAQHGLTLVDPPNVSPTAAEAADSAHAALPLFDSMGSAVLDAGTFTVAWSAPSDAGAPLFYLALAARDDAGPAFDSPAPPRRLYVGCGCTSAGPALPLVLLLLAIPKALGTSPPTLARGRPPRRHVRIAANPRNPCPGAVDRSLL
jgi:hypothetical protein